MLRLPLPPAASLLTAVLLTLTWPQAAVSSQSEARFTVRVNPPTVAAPGSGDGLCRSIDLTGAFGAEVTVVCATGTVVEIKPLNSHRAGTPIHGGAYRFFLPASLAGMIPSLDFDTGLGTVTTWRVVQASDWKYLEMMVQW